MDSRVKEAWFNGGKGEQEKRTSLEEEEGASDWTQKLSRRIWRVLVSLQV